MFPVLPPEYTPGGLSADSEQSTDTVPAPPAFLLPREPVESQGLIGARSPFACVPEADMDAEETAIGPPVDVVVSPASLARAPEELRQGPWSLLLAVATKGAALGTAPLVEDALLRRSDSALSDDDLTRLRPLADQVALLEAEYLAASAKYHDAEGDVPDPERWVNPQHLLEAMKHHERRMDRLQRGMRDADDRRSRAIDQLERARRGEPAGPPAASGGGVGGGRGEVGVEVTQTGNGTSRVRVGTRR